MDLTGLCVMKSSLVVPKHRTYLSHRLLHVLILTLGLVSAWAATTTTSTETSTSVAQSLLYDEASATVAKSSVLGVGSSLAAIMYEHAMVTYMFLQKPNAFLSYTSVNSGVGTCRIKDYYSYCDWDRLADPFADFAATESTLTGEDIERWPDLLTIPVVSAAVVLAVNINNYDHDAPPLILDRATVIHIFSGNITYWDDPRILVLQSDYVAVRLPHERINVIVRDDVSGTTEVFKKSLIQFAEDIELEGVDFPLEGAGNTEWPGLAASVGGAEFLQRRAGNNGMCAGVVLTSSSIAYVDLTTAQAMLLDVTDFQQESGAVVTADTSSVEYAMFEKGVVLDPVFNTADLMDARGDNAWPMCTYSYAIIRTNVRGDRLRQGATCETVLQSVLMFDWFFTSSVVEEMLSDYQMVGLPKSTRDGVMSQLNDVWCGGKLIRRDGQSDQLTGEIVTGQGIHVSQDVLELQFLAYGMSDPQTLLSYTPNATSGVVLPLNYTEMWRVVLGNDLFTQEWFTQNQYNENHDLLIGKTSYLALPWYLYPLMVVYHIPANYITDEDHLVLDKISLVALLSGELSSWDDSHLNLLNPWLADRYLDNILYMAGLDTQDDVMYEMLLDVLGLSNMPAAGLRRTHAFKSYRQILEAVEVTPGAMAIIPYLQFDSRNVRYAWINLVDSDPDNAVPPSIQSLKQCVGPFSFNPLTFEFRRDTSTPSSVSGSNVSQCYALSAPVYVVFHYSYADSASMCTDPLAMGVQATGFMRYLFLTGESEQPILDINALPLNHHTGQPYHLERLNQVLKYMPCGYMEPVQSDNTAFLMLIMILGACGFVALLILIVGLSCYCQRIKRLKLNPLYGINVQGVLEELLAEMEDEDGGNVATYIPELEKVDPDLFGIAIMTCAGKMYSVGDSDETFSIQSISKPFLYAFGLDYNGFALMREKIGVEPSGEAFNSEKMGPGNKPFNPYVNAGAIAAVGMLPFGEAEERYEIIRKYMSDLSYSFDLELCEDTYSSESLTATQNRLISTVLLANNIIPSEFDREHGLEAYFMACSTLVTAMDLACMGCCLATAGHHPMTKAHLIGSEIVDEVVSVMMTCGMYNGAGNWMIDVGLPAKSGVSGGIMAVVPNVCAIAVYSPRLNQHYNSVRGMLCCTELSQRLGLHLISRSKGENGSTGSRGLSKGYSSKMGGSLSRGSSASGSSKKSIMKK
mmetsp:Transcript_9355/g.17505  ORF Transcript_9355/g.17505 Transcript_9355/m.17505 type:complete len:1198 (-) Transcript_9355:274-3867(-)